MNPPDPITRLNAALEGRYRIDRELGEGGMATVYLENDLKHERKVALKVLKPELGPWSGPSGSASSCGTSPTACPGPCDVLGEGPGVRLPVKWCLPMGKVYVPGGDHTGTSLAA